MLKSHLALSATVLGTLCISCNHPARVVGSWSADVYKVSQEYTFDPNGTFTTLSKIPGEGWAEASGVYALSNNVLFLKIEHVDTSGLAGPKAAADAAAGKRQEGAVQSGDLTWANDNQFVFSTDPPAKRSITFNRKK